MYSNNWWRHPRSSSSSNLCSFTHFYLIFLGEGRAGIQHEVSLTHGVPGRQLPIRGTWRMRKLSVFTAADLERRGIPEQALTPGGRKEMLSTVVGKMTTFDLWPLPLGGGAWDAGTNMWHPEAPASYESFPSPRDTQIPTLWMHTPGGRGRGGLWY